jgi:hypothetical protein
MSMDEEPELPQPVPEIPRGPLWRALAIPPIVTVSTMLIIALLNTNHAGEIFLLLVPPPILWMILTFAIVFNRAVSQRYRGNSLIFLNVAYIFGEGLVCLSLWYGCCVLLF